MILQLLLRLLLCSSFNFLQVIFHSTISFSCCATAAKYESGGSKHHIPADINVDLYDEIMRLALLAHQSLGCRGVTRADFRYDGKEIYILEVNTQPGLTSTSLVPEQAAHVDMSFNQLVTWMVDNAENDA